MATAVDAAIAEIRKYREEYGPQLEGLRDYSRLNLQDGTKAVVAEMIRVYESRMDILMHTENHLVLLNQNGHPDIPKREVDDAIFADLRENRSTIEAAFQRFSTSSQAASLGLTTGTPEPK